MSPPPRAVFFLLYLLVFPRLNAWVQRVLMGDGEALVAEANVIYYLFLFIITLFQKQPPSQRREGEGGPPQRPSSRLSPFKAPWNTPRSLPPHPLPRWC